MVFYHENQYKYECFDLARAIGNFQNPQSHTSADQRHLEPMQRQRQHLPHFLLPSKLLRQPRQLQVEQLQS